MIQLSIYDAIAHAEAYPYLWAWGNTQKYPELGKRKGKPCAVIARGSMNSALLEFEDGWRVVTSRNCLRKRF